ncbi:MAG: DUF4089 domain-containing protein [Candidatus Rokuibacteriota bacterium]|nr:MAG: DUF4089 domain-containing protein [Candidatus Rokubacteria bacterium]
MSDAPEPAPKPETIARYVDEVAPLLGLTIPAECREGVARHLAMLFAAGALIRDFPVGGAETAPVFEP